MRERVLVLRPAAHLERKETRGLDLGQRETVRRWRELRFFVEDESLAADLRERLDELVVGEELTPARALVVAQIERVREDDVRSAGEIDVAIRDVGQRAVEGDAKSKERRRLGAARERSR